MGKSILKVKGYKAEDIKGLLKSNDSYIIGLRLYLVYQVALGYSCRELARLHHVSFKQVANWVHRFENEGIEGLKDRKGRGRKPLLSNAQLDRLKALILTAVPSDHGLNAEQWTGPLLIQWIKNEYGIEYQKAQIYNILDKIGVVFHKKQGLVEEKQINSVNI